MGTYYIGNIPCSGDDIKHYGRKGMKWGKNVFTTWAEYMKGLGKDTAIAYIRGLNKNNNTSAYNTTPVTPKPNNSGINVKNQHGGGGGKMDATPGQQSFVDKFVFGGDRAKYKTLAKAVSNAKSSNAGSLISSVANKAMQSSKGMLGVPKAFAEDFKASQEAQRRELEDPNSDYNKTVREYEEMLAEKSSYRDEANTKKKALDGVYSNLYKKYEKEQKRNASIVEFLGGPNLGSAAKILYIRDKVMNDPEYIKAKAEYEEAWDKYEHYDPYADGHVKGKKS